MANKAFLWITAIAAGIGMVVGYGLAVTYSGNSLMSVPALKNSGILNSGEGGNKVTDHKILYYKNPMGLADTSPVPKKDGMGMDYVPVYAEDEAGNNSGVLNLSTEKIQKLGVKTALVERHEIFRTIRTLGIIEVDERHLYNVTLKFDGFIEKLFVNATGQPVRQGQPLFELYSPELVTAQREYLAARKARAAVSGAEPWLQSGMENMAESSLERLRNWGVSDTELASLEQSGKARHNLTIRSPARGIVMEKMAIEGSRITQGEVLYKIADLSKVWVMADINEQDIGLIRLLQDVLVKLVAFPNHIYKGRVDFIYPTLNQTTRTVKVRVELPNPQALLKPMMYAQLEIAADKHGSLAVPTAALLESGRRSLVLVSKGNGQFEPRQVIPGIRGEDYVEILEGLAEREQVVTAANFLIDAESNLKAAVAGFQKANDQSNSLAKAGSLPKPSLDAVDSGSNGSPTKQ